jgi:hypothetical protein
MRTVTFKGEVLHKGSHAYELLTQAQHTGKAEDMRKYEQHMREVNQQFKKQCGVK